MAYRLSSTLRVTGVFQQAAGLGQLSASKFGGACGAMSVRHMAAGLGEFGSGAGKGGGTGGSIRDAGGSLGKMEAAHEEEYFRRVRTIQLRKLKEHMEHEVEEHERKIREHQEAIERHKKHIQKISQHEKEITGKKT